jgi:hypothetical protein
LNKIFIPHIRDKHIPKSCDYKQTAAGLMQLIVVSGTIQANIATSGAITLGQFYKVAVACEQDDLFFT